jgi:hypothetical protein
MFEIKINTASIDRVMSRLKKIPNGSWMPRFLLDIAGVVIGSTSSGLKRYATWRKITRKQVYGKSFFSTAQQKAFFAKMKSGEISIPYHRTGKQGAAWHISKAGQSVVTVTNNEESVIRTRGQTKLHKAMGWLDTKAQVNSDLPTAKQKAIRGLLDWLKSLS